MRYPIALSVLLIPVAATAEPEVIVGYETGPTYVAQNDGRYGVDGTAYEAGDVGQQDTLAVASRTTAELRFGRHAIIGLYAPFQLESRVALADELRFRDQTFAAGAVVDHRYVFDGFRLSYLYAALPRGRAFQIEVGASAQIRSAEVAFSAVDGTQYSEQNDIGFVGALKTRITYQPRATWWGQLEADALSTFGLVGDTSGALYDVALTAGRPVRSGIDAHVTLRLLGGGADVPSQAIDNWGNYVSATAGLRIELGAL